MAGMSDMLVFATIFAALACAADGTARTTIRLSVPPQVAAEAAARTSGDTEAPPPVLMLEGLEVGAGEGLTIRVLAPATAGSKVLAEAGTVGEPQERPRQPLQRMTLAVPLDREASRLLADKREITLTLEVAYSPGRPPLQFERAYFDTGDRARNLH